MVAILLRNGVPADHGLKQQPWRHLQTLLVDIQDTIFISDGKVQHEHECESYNIETFQMTRESKLLQADWRVGESFETVDYYIHMVSLKEWVPIPIPIPIHVRKPKQTTIILTCSLPQPRKQMHLREVCVSQRPKGVFEEA